MVFIKLDAVLFIMQWLEVRQPDLIGRARGPAEILRKFLRKRPRKKKLQ